jgi:hypothetical protein
MAAFSPAGTYDLLECKRLTGNAQMLAQLMLQADTQCDETS